MLNCLAPLRVLNARHCSTISDTLLHRRDIRAAADWLSRAASSRPTMPMHARESLNRDNALDNTGSDVDDTRRQGALVYSQSVVHRGDLGRARRKTVGAHDL